MAEPTGSALIQWPETATVDRALPKERLYAETSAGAALKQRFVNEVHRVRWAYKLGEESLRLRPGQTVTEIQVFLIELKGSSLHNAVLASIDSSVPSQIVFELRREDGLWAEQAMAAAPKTTGSKPKGVDYLRTGWVGIGEPRISMPTALDMDMLYDQLLGRLLPHPMRPSEDLPSALDRMRQIRILTRDTSVLEKRMRAEVQFNRRVELRADVRARQAELSALTDDHGDHKTEAGAWNG